MNHFLITRFNLKNPHWKNSKNEYHVLSKEWLDERFRIFETYCLPSVKNQSNQNFIWFVFFDVDTPQLYIQKINLITEQYPNFEPIYIDGFKELGSALQQYIETSQPDPNAFFITTRLDNDDTIHKDFIKTIQKLYIPKAKTVIDLRLGYQVILLNGKDIEIRNYQLQYNPFLSLISNLVDFDNIMTQKHDYWKTFPNTIINDTDHLWIQVIHQNNKLNRKLKTLKKVKAIDTTDFGIEIPDVKESRFQIAFYNVMMMPYRLYWGLKSFVKKIIKEN